MSGNHEVPSNHSHEEKHGHSPTQDHNHTDGDNKLVTAIAHFFKPHSHDAADSIDGALEGSKEGIKTLKITFAILGATALFQVIIVLMSGSVALLADTIHNFADATTAIPLWIAFSLGRKAATKQYTYGFGKAEDLAGLFIILMVAGSAAVAGWESIQRILHPQAITNISWVILAAIIGFIGNEWVAQYRIKTGNRIGSAALIADGYHARTDGFTSLAVLFGAIGVLLGFPQADSLVGVGITIAILFVLKDATLQIWHRLMDAVDPELVHTLEHAAKASEGVQEVSAVKLRWIGHSLHAEVEITADCRLSLEQAHKISEHAHHNMLHAMPKLASVSVHIEPCIHGKQIRHAEYAHHNKQINEIIVQ